MNTWMCPYRSVPTCSTGTRCSSSGAWLHYSVLSAASLICTQAMFSSSSHGFMLPEATLEDVTRQRADYESAAKHGHETRDALIRYAFDFLFVMPLFQL
jgi:hypothetical protein